MEYVFILSYHSENEIHFEQNPLQKMISFGKKNWNRIVFSQSQVRGEQQCWIRPRLAFIISVQFISIFSVNQSHPIPNNINVQICTHNLYIFFFGRGRGSTFVVVKLPQLHCYNFTSFCAIIGGVDHLITWAERGEERLWKLIMDDCEETGDVLLYSQVQLL